MPEQNLNFLPFFFREPVYLVPESDSTDPTPPYQPLGENRRKILVLVEDPDAYHLNEPELLLLTKILQALGLSPDDIWLINVSRAETPAQVEGELAFTHCVSFGMPPESWQLSNFFRKYEVISDENERAFLYADTLSEIKGNVEKKKLLWLQLKALFHYE